MTNIFATLAALVAQCTPLRSLLSFCFVLEIAPMRRAYIVRTVNECTYLYVFQQEAWLAS